MIITGGKTSFIGRNLCDFYKDKYEIHTMDKWTKPQQYLENHVKPDIIIHAGAEIYNDDAMFQYNIERSKEILDYCRYNLIEKVIIFGSSSEYGRVSWPISEDHGLNPNTMYEATKGAVSLLAQGYSKTYDIPITLIRPFTIVGRYEKPHKFFPTLYRAARKNLPIKLAPGVHDFVFIDDFLAAFDVLLNRKEEALFNVINIGSGRQTSNHEINCSYDISLSFSDSSKRNCS